VSTLTIIDSIGLIVSNQLLIALNCIGLCAHPHPHKEFEWSPSNHRSIAHRYPSFASNIIELMMIRGISDASSITPWLPNELMFEIFRALFDAYHRQL